MPRATPVPLTSLAPTVGRCTHGHRLAARDLCVNGVFFGGVLGCSNFYLRFVEAGRQVERVSYFDVSLLPFMKSKKMQKREKVYAVCEQMMM